MAGRLLVRGSYTPNFYTQFLKAYFLENSHPLLLINFPTGDRYLYKITDLLKDLGICTNQRIVTSSIYVPVLYNKCDKVVGLIEKQINKTVLFREENLENLAPIKVQDTNDTLWGEILEEYHSWIFQ